MTDTLIPTYESGRTEDATTQNTPGSNKHGCFFWGCMGCAGFGILLIIGLVIGGRWMWNNMTEIAVEWSGDKPLEMRTIAVSGTTDLEQRWQTLEDAVEENIPGTYIIDQDMIDLGLVEDDIGQYVDVLLGSGEVTLRTSIPLEELEVDDIQDRFLNAEIRGTFDYRSGKIEAYILEVDIPGKQLPREMEELYRENIGSHMYREEEFVEFIQQFDAIYFSGSQIVVEIGE